MASTIKVFATPHPTGGSGPVATIATGPDSGPFTGLGAISTTGWTPGTYSITSTSTLTGKSESLPSNAVSLTVNAAGPSILSATTTQNTAAGRTVSVTVPSIPANALVVLLATTTGYVGTNATASGVALGAFTHRRRYPDGGGAGTVEALTVRNGATPRTNEVVTFTNGDATAAETSCACVLVVSATTNTVAFTDGGSAGASVTAVSLSHAATGTGSLLLAAVKIAPDSAIAQSIAPSAGTTEIAEAASNPGASGSLRSHIWVSRVDGFVTAPSSGAAAGTISGAGAGWGGFVMELVG